MVKLDELEPSTGAHCPSNRRGGLALSQAVGTCVNMVLHICTHAGEPTQGAELLLRVSQPWVVSVVMAVYAHVTA